MNCNLCKYWCCQLDDHNGEEHYGECRRYPPTQKQNGAILSFDSFSGTRHCMDTSAFEIITHRHHWCGEYKEKVREQTDE